MSPIAHSVDHGAVGMPVAKRDVDRKTRDSGSSTRTVSAVFYFAAQRWLTGSLWATKGLLAGGIAFFLLTQLSAAPRLAVQLYFCSAFMFAVAVVGFSLAARDLLTVVKVNEEGIEIRSLFLIRSIPWTQLEAWTVRTGHLICTHVPSVLFWIEHEKLPVEIPSGSLTYKDHVALRAILNDYVPQKARA